MSASWSSNLCGCGNDVSSCCYGFWCLPCLVGDNASKVRDEGCCGTCCLFMLLQPLLLGACVGRCVRRDVREKFGLPDEPCPDCCVYFFCPYCAACQEAREIKGRTLGMKPSTPKGKKGVPQPIITTTAPSPVII